MAATDTAKAVLAKASLFDQAFSKPDIGMAIAWAEALRDVNPADALAAVTAHYAKPEPAHIAPGDVLAGVRRIRAERLRLAGNAEPEYDRDDVLGGLAAIRAQRSAVADGAPGPAPLAIDQEGRDEVRKRLERTSVSMRRAALRPKEAS